MHSLRDVQRAFARSVLSDDAAPLAALMGPERLRARIDAAAALAAAG